MTEQTTDLIIVEGLELSVSVFPHVNEDGEEGFIVQHEYLTSPDSPRLLMWNFYKTFDEAQSALPMMNIIAARAVGRRLEDKRVKDDRTDH